MTHWHSLRHKINFIVFLNSLQFFYSSLLTYSLHAARVLPYKLTVSQLVKKFPAFFGTRKFITAFKSAGPLSLSLTRTIQSRTPHSNFWRFILILSFLLHLCLPSNIFHSDFPTKTLYVPVFSPYVLHVTPTLFFSFWSPEWYLESSTDN